VKATKSVIKDATPITKMSMSQKVAWRMLSSGGELNIGTLSTKNRGSTAGPGKPSIIGRYQERNFFYF
jgi:hypothetical protein